MLHDYKGETPKNVITEEEHKKRPFYKKVSFWVLSALGLFFGGCSVYGLVLGYQYVHAVTEAAHIIADANDDDDVDVSGYGEKQRFNFAVPSTTYHIDLILSLEGGIVYDLTNGNMYTSTSSMQSTCPYGRYYDGDTFTLGMRISGGNNNLYLTQVTTFYHNLSLIVDGVPFDLDSYFATSLANSTSFLFPSGSSTLKITADFSFKPYDTGYAEGYSSGYDDGYQEGYNDGYQEGFSDGSDAINLPQSVKVLLPAGNEYSVQYKTYIDGVLDLQGQLNSSQSSGAYLTFDRSRTQKLRVDLTLPTDSRAFFLYTPSWTSSYPTDENYSLRQSWAVSGVTYLPTWVTNPQVYVGFTSADVPDLTYQTISVAFDVDHWGDIKVGAYAEGYADGYQDGESNPTAYDSGYEAGYSEGYDDGKLVGINQGESQAVSGQKALVTMFVTAFQQPFDQIYRFLNFNVLGLNILALFTSLLTLSIGIIIIKKVI